MPTFFRLFSVALLASMAMSGCNSAPSTDTTDSVAPEAQPIAAATSPSASTDTTLAGQLQNPQVGDVYVVQFQPRNTTDQRYYFYQVFAVRPNEVDLHPARQESQDPQADISAPRFFAEDAGSAMTYTRAQARELLQEQPGDVQHTRLIAVRRSPK